MPYCIFTVIWVPFSCLVAVPFSVYPLPLRVEGFYPSFSYHTQFPASRKREGDFPQCHVPKVLCACGHTLPGPESVAGYTAPHVTTGHWVVVQFGLL